MSVAHKPAGSPHLRASQGLLPGAPPKRGATYQSYLERPTKPTSRGRGVHTYIPRLLQDFMKHKLKRGAPTKGTQPLRPLQIAASASNGAQTRSGRTYTCILPCFFQKVGTKKWEPLIFFEPLPVEQNFGCKRTTPRRGGNKL